MVGVNEAENSSYNTHDARILTCFREVYGNLISHYKNQN